MNFVAHERTQRLVDKLVPRDPAHAFELRGDNERLEVRVVVGKHLDSGTVESGFDQSRYFQWIHHASLCASPFVYHNSPSLARLNK